MKRNFRLNLLFAALPLVPLFGCSSISVIQRQVNVLEVIRPNESYHDPSDFNKSYETCSQVITRTCVEDAISPQDFDNLLSKGVKVITANNNWRQTIELKY